MMHSSVRSACWRLIVVAILGGHAVIPRVAVAQGGLEVARRPTLRQELFRFVPVSRYSDIPSRDEWVADYTRTGACINVAAPDSIALISSGRDSIRVGSWPPSAFGKTFAWWSHYLLAPTRPDTLWAAVAAARACTIGDGAHPVILAVVGGAAFSVEIGELNPGRVWARSGKGLDSLVLVRSTDTSFVGTQVQQDLRTLIDIGRQVQADSVRAARIRRLGWPPRMAAAVVEHRVVPGMSPAMVREAWGEPTSVTRTTTAAGVTETWRYGPRSQVDIASGKVVAIRELNP